jgi:mannose-6-phosphate isomerase-like protein (cupin superfamily)
MNVATIEKITDGEKTLAMIIPADFRRDGIEFFTPDSYSQQLAFMSHPAGKSIVPHSHNLVMRHVDFTQEVLFLRKGRLRVDFFDDSRKYLESYVLKAGDVILLVSGGHGFEVLEDIEMFEVKQGPYVGEEDKTRFNPGAFSVTYKRQSDE